MIQQRGILAKACLGLAALFLLANASLAAGIGFRNDTPFFVVVQGATNAGGVVRRGPALIIPPGKTAWDNNLPPGVNRDITVYDPDQGNAVILRQPIFVQGQNLFFSIQPVPPPPGQAKGVQFKAMPLPPNSP